MEGAGSTSRMRMACRVSRVRGNSAHCTGSMADRSVWASDTMTDMAERARTSTRGVGRRNHRRGLAQRQCALGNVRLALKHFPGNLKVDIRGRLQDKIIQMPVISG